MAPSGKQQGDGRRSSPCGTLVRAKDLQQDVVFCLERGGYLDAAAALEDCTRKRCGSACHGACAIGARRRSLAIVRQATALSSDPSQSVSELFITMGSWGRPAGQLSCASIPAAKQCIRRTLDKLMDPELIAVGCFDAYPVADGATWGWRCAVRLLVIGASRKELWHLFELSRVSPVERVTDGGAAAKELFKFGLREWPHGGCGPITVEDSHRQEYYEWLLSLRRDERIIRYGVDRHFRQLEKAPRTIRPKVKKKRPYPWQLTPYMYREE